MELTREQYRMIEPHLPVQRGNVSVSNLQVLNAFLYVAEHGSKWRGLPKRFGNLSRASTIPHRGHEYSPGDFGCEAVAI